jgi:glycosyltransferase involved in cell wall biosynthesis
MAEWLSRLTALGSRPVRVFPCPVHVEHFSQRSHTEDVLRLVVAYVGGLQVYQPPEMVARALAAVAAASALPIVAWVITPSGHDEVRGLLREHGIDGRVEGLEHAAVQSRLCEADVGIVPRAVDPVSWVSCPTKIGEYLAAGVPVLAGEGVGHWADRLSAQGVGAPLGLGNTLGDSALNLIAELPAGRAAYASRCRGVAEREWSWRNSAPRLLDLYAEVLAVEGIE